LCDNLPLDWKDGRIEKARKRVEDNEDILPENREAILDFDRELELNDYSVSRRYKYLTRLPKIGEVLDVAFKDAEREHIEEIVLWLKRREDINKTTQNDYKILLRRFYKWLNDGEYPECIEWLEVDNNLDSDKLPEEMLSEEDVEELLKNAQNPRDKAIISMLWETGCRISELLSLTIRSIEDHKHGFKIVVEGKTGARRLPLIESVPYLQQWLEEHPERENKDAPLWVNIGQVNKGEKMAYRSVRKMLNEVGKRANLDKPNHPSHFRDSRATYLASRFTEAQMCQWFGWVQGSDVPAKYVHMSGRDIDPDYARLHGIEEEEDHKVSKLIPDECPRCGETVPKEASFCSNCGQALSREAISEVEEDEEKVIKDFMEFIEDNPELKDAIEKKRGKENASNED